MCYRCSWGHPSGWEAWSRHWHHGSSSSWCSGLMEWKRVNKTRCLLFYGCVRATQRGWLSISYPVMSCLGITGLDWRSYHGEVRVNPHKRTDTHGYGLKVWTRGDGEEEVGCYYTTFQMKIWQNEHRKQKFKVKKKKGQTHRMLDKTSWHTRNEDTPQQKAQLHLQFLLSICIWTGVQRAVKLVSCSLQMEASNQLQCPGLPQLNQVSKKTQKLIAVSKQQLLNAVLSLPPSSLSSKYSRNTH